jgi:hypothetical protein
MYTCDVNSANGRRGVNKILPGWLQMRRRDAAQGEAAEEDGRGEKLFLGRNEKD